MAQASFGYFGIGHENPAAVGTAVAPKLFLPVKDVNFPIENNFIDVVEIRGSRQAYQKFDGPQRPSVTFSSAFYPAGAMGLLLKGLFGTVSTAAAGASATGKVHTFGDTSELPSISAERSDAQSGSSGILLQRLNGCKVESMSFTSNYGEEVDVQITMQGLSFPTTPGAKPSSFTFPAMEPFTFVSSSIYVDGVISNLFKTVTFDFTNTLERQEVLNGTRYAYKMFEGGLDCTLNGTLVFESIAMYDKLKNSEDFEVKVVFEGAEFDATENVSYTAEFTWPKVKIATFDVPMTAGDVIEADVEFEVSFDLVANKSVEVKLTNQDAAATYAYPTP